MKKVVLLLVTVLAFNLSNAQVLSPERLQNVVNLVNGAPQIPVYEYVDIFIDAPNQPKKQVFKVVDTEKKRVVLVPGKTAKEIYTMVEIAVAKHWKNPNEVIEGKVEGKYIKIRGGGSNVHFNSLGMVYTYSTVAAYMIQFKDGKFMYTIGYETRFPPSKYSVGGLFPTGIKTYRKNGKPVKSGILDVASINAGVNTFINTILESNPETGIDSDW